MGSNAEKRESKNKRGPLYKTGSNSRTEDVSKKWRRELSREELEILGDIEIEDDELQRRIDKGEKEKIMVYGELNTPLDEEEESVMKLNPKMCLYEKVTLKGVRADLEEAFTNISYNRRVTKERRKEWS